MKLTVIGGGGVRSMFLARSIAGRAEELHITELVFMDIDPEKLRVYGGMARHVAKLIYPALDFRLTCDAVEAVSGASYIITTIRVGGDEMRTRDEHIALEHKLLGQETTGAAGFSFAMRSIPVLTEYCDLIRKHAKPDVKVFNFTNPVGIVSQALRDMGYDFTYGICDAPSGMLHQFAGLYGVDREEIQGELFGLNHLSWFHSIKMNGLEIMPDLISRDDAYRRTDLRFFEKELVKSIGCVPNEYLYYFYYRTQAIENILKTGKTRGDIIHEINRAMLKDLAGMDIDNDFQACLEIYKKWYGMRENNYMVNETGIKRDTLWDFDIYARDSGGYAGVALKFMEIKQSGGTGSMIICVPNQGAVDFLSDTDTVELTCDITPKGYVPHRFPSIPAAQQELIRRVKFYERVGAQAIIHRDRLAAVESLMMHPLVNSWKLASTLADQYILMNLDFTGEWSEKR